MIIFPAIDLSRGKCVRLIQGRRNDETVYGDDPSRIAEKWQAAGAAWLHLVDLDGAFEGGSKNVSAIKSILAAIKIPAQLGGGIRTLDDIDRLLQLGLARVILGTVAVEKPSIVYEAVKLFGSGRIAVGIDARNGKVSVRGWTEDTAVTAKDLGKKMSTEGIKTFIYTDIARDGMLKGPNIPALKEFSEATGGGVIASGGIATLDDITAIAQLKNSGVIGMITGKALYENKFSLEDAIQAAK